MRRVMCGVGGIWAARRLRCGWRWIRQLACRMPFGKVLVAIANKHARQLWAMLAHAETYDAHAWLKHPMVQRPAGKHAVSVTAMA